MSATSKPRLLDADFERMLAMSFSPNDLLAMSPDEKRERRRMFFAGARALRRFVEEGMQPDGEITAGEMALVAAIEEELDDFVADLGAGRA